MNKSPLVTGAVAISSLAIGVVVGYRVAEKRLTVQFEERLIRETAGMRKFYTLHQKTYPDPTAAAEDLISSVEGEVVSEKIAYHKIVKSEYRPEDDPEEEVAIEAEYGEDDGTVTSNVFETKVDHEKPYLISQEEFMENEGGLNEATLTFYEKDHILADERDDVIENFDLVVGERNIQFGVGSSDKNTVHIRNEKLGMVFEVLRSENSYAQDVLGVDEVPQSRRHRAD